MLGTIGTAGAPQVSVAVATAISIPFLVIVLATLDTLAASVG